MKKNIIKFIPIFAVILILGLFNITARAEENKQLEPPAFYVCEAGCEYRGKIADVIPFDENNKIIVWEYLWKMNKVSVDPSIVATFTIGSVYSFSGQDYVCCKIEYSYYYFISDYDYKAGKTLDQVHSSAGTSYRVSKGGRTEYNIAAASNNYCQATQTETLNNVMTFIPKEATIEYTSEDYTDRNKRVISEMNFFQFEESGEKSYLMQYQNDFWRNIGMLQFYPEVTGIILKLKEIEIAG